MILSSRQCQALLALVAMLLFMPTGAHAGGNPQPVVNAVLKVVAITSAAKASEEVAQAGSEFLHETLPPGESIYSVRFNFTRASWADFWSRPDIFLVVECEGGERLLIPDVEYNWNYGTKIYRFRCPSLPAGSRCVLKLYDDDSASDLMWKTILSNKVSWNARAQATNSEAISGLVAISAQAQAGGELNLLDPQQAAAVTIDAADLVASAEFTVPDDATDRWEMQGTFLNGSTEYGDVQLIHWQANTLPVFLSYFLRPKLVFWSVVFLGVVAWLGTSYRRRARIEGKSLELQP
jgi:hypothetical protein